MGGLVIHKAEKQGDGGLVADRHLYLTRESDAGQRVVEKGDADAGFLLATPGSVIPADQVKAHRLEVKDDKIVQAKNADGTPVAVGASHDQETGPALKKAADEKRIADMGKTQTNVAVMEQPPGAEEGAKRRDAVAAAARTDAAAEPAKAAAKKKGK